MSVGKFPPCPPQLKSVQHYLKLASDYESRDPAITYWARLYALQTALKIDRKSPEAKALLTSLMDWLELFKKEHSNNDSITNDVAGQAVLENEAHKLFTKADTDDRASIFNKNVVKTFYTAGILFDVIEVFGELTDEIVAQRKYAKWKATYIHNCLKNGETPIPGPMGGESEHPTSIGTHPDSENMSAGGITGFHLPSVAPENDQTHHDPNLAHYPTHQAPESVELPQVSSNIPTPKPEVLPSTAGGLNLTREDYSKAQKYCKYAVSAIDYEDSPTAISYLTKALNILTTGKES